MILSARNVSKLRLNDFFVTAHRMVLSALYTNLAASKRFEFNNNGR